MRRFYLWLGLGCGLLALGAGVMLTDKPRLTSLWPGDLFYIVRGTDSSGSKAITASNFLVGLKGLANWPDTNNVKFYGAVGDGVTPDAWAIQACMNASLDVYIPPGVYLLEKELYPTNNHHIYGAGKWGGGTVLKLANQVATLIQTDVAGGATNVWVASTNGFYLGQLVSLFNGADAGYNNGDLARVYAIAGSVLTFDAPLYRGYATESNAAVYTTYNVFTLAEMDMASGWGLEQDGPTNVIIENLEMDGNKSGQPVQGNFVEVQMAVFGAFNDHCVIRDNYVHDFRMGGLTWGVDGTNMVIEGNWIANCDKNSSLNIHGGNRLRIVGNHVSNTNAFNQGTLTDVRDSLVSGNVISGGTAGWNITGCSGLNFVGELLMTNDYGYMLTTSTNVTITGANVQSRYNPIYGAATVFKLTLLGNRLAGGVSYPSPYRNGYPTLAYGNQGLNGALADIAPSRNFNVQVTNQLDFTGVNWLDCTNALTTNVVFQLTNIAPGAVVGVSLFGATAIASNYTVTFTATNGTRIIWPSGVTNGTYDFAVTSNQQAWVEFRATRQTNVLARLTSN